MSKNNYIPTRTSGGFVSTKGTGTKRKVLIALDPTVDYRGIIGKVPAPETEAIIVELRLAIGQALMELRNEVCTLRERATIISLMTKSIKDLNQITKLDQILDITKLSDEELKTYAEKIIANM